MHTPETIYIHEEATQISNQCRTELKQVNKSIVTVYKQPMLMENSI